MISTRAAFWLGHIWCSYLQARHDYYEYMGEYPDYGYSAIHIAKHLLPDGSVRIEIGVKYRPGKVIGSWFSLDEIPHEQADAYISQCREFITSVARAQKDELPIIEVEWPV